MMTADDGEQSPAQRHPAVTFLGLLVSIVICFGAASVGARFAPDRWYTELERPAFAPPNAVFGPVWTLLYLCMALASWRVWKRCDWQQAVLPLTVFAIQLVLNAAWSWLFFGWHRLDLALVDIVLLLGAIAVTLVMFYRRDRLAGWLMVPYLAWVGFAAVLNFAFWQLNQL